MDNNYKLKYLSWNIEKRKKRRDFLKIWFGNLSFMTAVILLIPLQFTESADLGFLESVIYIIIVTSLLCSGFILLRKWWKGDC